MRQISILLVEGDDSVRALAEDMLRQLGYRVTVAPDGITATALFEEGGGRFDLLFCDVSLPGDMDGFVLARRLKSDGPGLRVLYAASPADLVRPRLGIAYGKVIAKPYGIDELEAELMRTLAPMRARNPKHWREKAADFRDAARTSSAADETNRLLARADEFERMASAIERDLGPGPSRPTAPVHLGTTLVPSPAT